MDNSKIVNRISNVGIFGNMALAAFKLFVGVLGKSGAMISDAIHSMSDVIATFIAWVGTKASEKKEDSEHPYGHERFESMASLALGLILIAAGLSIGWDGAYKLIWNRGNIEIPTILPLIAAIVSILVKEGMFHYTMYYAKKINSTAFKADAWHHRSDAISSIGSFIGIGMAKLGFTFMEPVASMFICIFILKVAIEITQEAVNQILDTSCGKEFEDEVSDFIKGQGGVERIDSFRTRQFGNKAYADLEISVNSELSLIEAHGIAENVHDAVEQRFSNIKHIMVHVNPMIIA